MMNLVCLQLLIIAGQGDVEEIFVFTELPKGTTSGEDLRKLFLTLNIVLYIIPSSRICSSFKMQQPKESLLTLCWIRSRSTGGRTSRSPWWLLPLEPPPLHPLHQLLVNPCSRSSWIPPFLNSPFSPSTLVGAALVMAQGETFISERRLIKT